MSCAHRWTFKRSRTQERNKFNTSQSPMSEQIAVLFSFFFVVGMEFYAAWAMADADRKRPSEPQQAAATKRRRKDANPKEPMSSSSDSRDEEDKLPRASYKT